MFYFIINPASKTGLGKRLWTDLKAILDKQEIAYEYYFTKRQFHATNLIHEILAKEGEKHIVLLGGDGTLNEAINGLDHYENTTLSYIPSGSGNDFARSIHLKKNPEAILASLLSLPTVEYFDQAVSKVPLKDQPADTPYTDGRRFCISCGIGFDASICYEALHSPMKYVLNKLKLGKLTYVLIALKQIASYPLEDADVIIDGIETRHYRKIFFLAGMIQPYEGGGFCMTPLADAKDGKLSVAVYHSLPKSIALFMLPRILFGLQKHSKSFDTFSCSRIEVHTKAPLVVHTDGEYAGTTNTLEMEVLPEKIAFMR